MFDPPGIMILKLSKTALAALAALASDERMVISAMRSGPGAVWRADLSQRRGATRRTVPVPVFRTMLRHGLLAADDSYAVSGDLLVTEYVLTDAGRQQLC
jgi:hypothetical protein